MCSWFKCHYVISNFCCVSKVKWSLHWMHHLNLLFWIQTTNIPSTHPSHTESLKNILCKDEWRLRWWTHHTAWLPFGYAAYISGVATDKGVVIKEVTWSDNYLCSPWRCLLEKQITFATDTLLPSLVSYFFFFFFKWQLSQLEKEDELNKLRHA